MTLTTKIVSFSNELKIMSQLISGWRSILSLPKIYNLCTDILVRNHFHREFVNKHIQPKLQMRILDLGCGPASILEHLPRYVEYCGIDVDRGYIVDARKKHGDRATFYCMPLESIYDKEISGYDLVMGLGVLHHLDDENANAFFSLAASATHDEGRCLTIDPCKVKDQHFFARWLIGLDRGRNVRNADGYAALAKPYFKRLSQTLRHDLLRLPYTHYIMECHKM